MAETVIEQLRRMEEAMRCNGRVAVKCDELRALLAVVEAARELLHVADLCSGSCLLYPDNPPALLSFRMQAAWDNARTTLAELEKEAKG